MPFRKQDQPYTFVGSWNEVPCVYGIMNASGVMLYIGQADNVRRRMLEHQNDHLHLMHRHSPVYVWAEIINDPNQRSLREQQLIREYNPPGNKNLIR